MLEGKMLEPKQLESLDLQEQVTGLRRAVKMLEDSL